MKKKLLMTMTLLGVVFGIHQSLSETDNVMDQIAMKKLNQSHVLIEVINQTMIKPEELLIRN